MNTLIGMNLYLYIAVSIAVSLIWLIGIVEISESEIGVIAGGMFCPFIGYFWPFSLVFFAFIVVLSLFALLGLSLRDVLN